MAMVAGSATSGLHEVTALTPYTGLLESDEDAGIDDARLG